MKLLFSLPVILGAVFLACLAAPPGLAQDFVVTVGPKTQAHPQHGQGWPESYRINGVDGAELTLQRGETYVFQMSNVPAKHPFYISTSSSGVGAGVWNDGVDGNFATGNAVLTFSVPDHAPDELWYQCASHMFMGWRIVVQDAVGSDEGATPALFAVEGPYPNPVGDLVSLRLDLPQPAVVRVTIADLLGRRVAQQSFGMMEAGRGLPVDIDVAELAPGAYVFRVEAETGSEVLSAGGRLVRVH